MLLVVTVLFSTVGMGQDDATYKHLSQMANTYFANKEYKRAAETLESAIAIKGPKSGYIEVYNAACAWALAGYPDNAFKHLDFLASRLMKDPEGYMGDSHMDYMTYVVEKDFESLHGDPRWNRFISRLQKRRKPLELQLDSIYFDDQRGRRLLDETEEKYGATSKEMEALWKDIHTQDSVNLVKVKQIIERYGWPSVDSVGRRGNSTVFLVIQHADPATQVHYLPIMRQAVKDKKARGDQLALLEDRVALGQGKKQVYGTQVMKIGGGDWYVRPMEDPDHVDERRKSVGLGRLYYYLRDFNINWDVEKYKEQLPAIEQMEQRLMK